MTGATAQAGDRLRALRGAHWAGFFALLLAAWAALLALQAGAPGAGLWEALCSVAPGNAAAPALFLMWALMAAAMMAPTAVPALATWDDLRAARAARASGFASLAAGYLAVWLGFAAVATVAQIALSGAGLLTPAGASAERWLTVSLLAAAGAWQLSGVKAACLDRCRHPLTLFIGHWAEGPFRLGLRLGALCLGCCWALMLLAFVGGTMNLIWMGGAMVLMTLEKLPRPGQPLTVPLGLALLAAAGFVAAAGVGGGG